MIELASTVVQVVTSGVDWPAVAAAISGGVVGLAGIVMTFRQSSKSVSAEDKRAELAEKRRVYARFHTSLDNVFAIAAPNTTRPTADMLSDLDAALPTMYNAASELRLIASPKVGQQARAVATKLANQALAAINNRNEIDKDNEVYNMREQLYTLMRADLGEPDTGGEILPRTVGPEKRLGAPHVV